MVDRLRIGDTLKRRRSFKKEDKLSMKDQSRIPADPKSARSAYNYSDVINQRRNANAEAAAAKVKQPRRPFTPTPGIVAPESNTPETTPRSPVKQAQTAKAPASGTMSHTPEKGAIQASRGAVTSSIDKKSADTVSNIISGSEAIRRAKTQAEKDELNRIFYGGTH